MASAPNPPNVRTISNFKSALRGGGARPNLFEVAIPDMPSYVDGGIYGNVDKSTLRFMCKAANMPASNVAPVDVPFRGRILKVAGDRTFDPWTITVINNTDWALRQTFEDWSNMINNRVYDFGVTQPVEYHTNASVLQLARNTPAGTGQDQTGDSNIPIVSKYKFYGMWPSQVSSVALDYGSTDTIEEFQVTFQVEYWNQMDPKWEEQGKGG